MLDWLFHLWLDLTIQKWEFVEVPGFTSNSRFQIDLTVDFTFMLFAWFIFGQLFKIII